MGLLWFVDLNLNANIVYPYTHQVPILKKYRPSPSAMQGYKKGLHLCEYVPHANFGVWEQTQYREI